MKMVCLQKSSLSLAHLVVLVQWLFVATWLQPVDGEGYPLHQQDFVVKLSDETFEHDTQAYTGGTTGSWLVWLHGHHDNTPIGGEVPTPDFWSDNHVVLASVDVRMYPHTARRFGLVEMVPLFIFLHKGKYYQLDLKNEEGGYDWPKIQEFVTEGFAQTTAHDIPPPRTLQDEVIEMAHAFYYKMSGPLLPWFMYFFAVAGSLGMLNIFFPAPKSPLDDLPPPGEEAKEEESKDDKSQDAKKPSSNNKKKNNKKKTS